VLIVKLTKLAFVSALALQASCAEHSKPEKFYVVAPTGGEQYQLDMTGLAAQHGLNPNPSTLNDSWGATLSAIEGKGRGVTLWSINVPLSAREAVACGGPQGTHNDQTQFVVTISNRRVFGEDEVAVVTAALKAGLLEKGYEVRAEPRTCASPAAGQ
jgi:hypothetical protein